MENPFRPGAGHKPPYLAGREEETREFEELLRQRVILKNLILTGLRGIGKTVLLDSFKPISLKNGWLWTGTDCSESASVTEETMAVRLITDLALLTSNVKIGETQLIGFNSGEDGEGQYLSYEVLANLYQRTPGLASDRLKKVLETVWELMKGEGYKGIVFAYDEAQLLADHAQDKMYPLSLLLDTFQSIQKKEIPFMLVLTGLPTLLQNLVETRTFSERLFHVVTLDKLDGNESRDAILKPFEKCSAPPFSEGSIDMIIRESGGYPYFIQFICKEIYDIFLQQMDKGEVPQVPMDAIIQKLDNDFFAGRWARATDRERELMTVIAHQSKEEFGIKDIEISFQGRPERPISSSQINQMLKSLIQAGLVYKNRRGSYSFAVPLLEKYILRQNTQSRQN